MLRSCVALLAIAASASSAAPPNELSGTAQVRVEITRRGDEWTAEYEFDREAPVWVFPRTDVTREDPHSWRPLSWRVETRGVRLERRGFLRCVERARQGSSTCAYPVHAICERTAGRLHPGIDVHRWIGRAVRGAVRDVSDGIGRVGQSAAQRSQQSVGTGRIAYLCVAR
jgi:hypothetical protein